MKICSSQDVFRHSKDTRQHEEIESKDSKQSRWNRFAPRFQPDDLQVGRSPANAEGNIANTNRLSRTLSNNGWACIRRHSFMRACSLSVHCRVSVAHGQAARSSVRCRGNHSRAHGIYLARNISRKSSLSFFISCSVGASIINIFATTLSAPRTGG